ncbi:MAG TPA: acetate/propionate family kinase [Candidatus Binatus sp.]|uniref:acetate/propionate family kinase n=1 Tax=Candidatus Binatus sp. TaxID=2811406 RepID=UPI002F422BCC
MPARHTILCINVGSSSCKFALYSISGGTESVMAEGAADRVGSSGGKITIRDANGRSLAESDRELARPQVAVNALFDEFERLKLPGPDAVGHRIVHGGASHVVPELVTPALLTDLKRLIPFAPLHMPGGIEGIEAVAARHPKVAQVACFDTAFHRGMPARAERFPLPRDLYDAGVRRYGFHGISYEYIMRALGADVPRRLIIAHLGNGASMAAVHDGRPLDTTMGFTPAGGFMMGTRPGDLDPGLILYLLQQKKYDAARLGELVNQKSGLLGVSALSSDLKILLDARATNADAALAIEMFCYQIKKAIGALSAALGGLDLLVFTGGIGEHAAAVRAEVCAGLAHLGLAIDTRRNDSGEDSISTIDSRCSVRVIPTNENLMVALHTARLVFV